VADWEADMVTRADRLPGLGWAVSPLLLVKTLRLDEDVTSIRLCVKTIVLVDRDLLPGRSLGDYTSYSIASHHWAAKNYMTGRTVFRTGFT